MDEYTTLVLDEMQCKLIIRSVEDHLDMLYHVSHSKLAEESDLAEGIYKQIPSRYFEEMVVIHE